MIYINYNKKIKIFKKLINKIFRAGKKEGNDLEGRNPEMTFMGVEGREGTQARERDWERLYSVCLPHTPMCYTCLSSKIKLRCTEGRGKTPTILAQWVIYSSVLSSHKADLGHTLSHTCSDSPLCVHLPADWKPAESSVYVRIILQSFSFLASIYSTNVS